MSDTPTPADIAALWKEAEALHHAAMEEEYNCLYHDKYPHHFPSPGDAAKAYDLERQAADIVYKIQLRARVQPSFAILHRSAAWLAFAAGRPSEAIRMAIRGVEGATGEATPGCVFEELHQVLEAAQRVIEAKEASGK